MGSAKAKMYDHPISNEFIQPYLGYLKPQLAELLLKY